MANDITLVLRGTIDWAKITGDPRPHTGKAIYDKGPLWSTDFTPNAASRKLIAEAGASSKLREPNRASEKEHRTETFLSFKTLLNRADGKQNAPPLIKDAQGNLWDDRLIGNGTVVDVKVKIVDYGKAAEKGCYLQAVRVLDLVPYESNDFEPLSEDDEFFGKSGGEAVKGSPEPTDSEDNLDDDIAF